MATGNEIVRYIPTNTPNLAASTSLSHSTFPQQVENEVGTVITMSDPELLECPICVEPLCSPIYQCENGHLACGLCCSKIFNQCPSCSYPIGYNRCRAMEKVIETIKFSCQNMQYGCTEKSSYVMKLHHESACNYPPCSCPYPGCEYIGLSSYVYTHFAELHPAYLFSYNITISLRVSNNMKYVFLRERRENTLYVLNHVIVPYGCLVNVICIAPASSNKDIMCDLTVTAETAYVKFRSRVDVMPKWIEGSSATNYLIVPGYFADSDGVTLKLTLEKVR